MTTTMKEESDGQMFVTDFDGSTPSEHQPRKRNKPCENCRKQRRKCVIPPEGERICERCRRLRLHCYFSQDISLKERKALLAKAKSSRKSSPTSPFGIEEADMIDVASQSEVELLEEQIRQIEEEMKRVLAQKAAASNASNTPLDIDDELDMSNAMIPMDGITGDSLLIDTLFSDYVTDEALQSPLGLDWTSLSTSDESEGRGASDDSTIESNLALTSKAVADVISSFQHGDSPPWRFTLTKNGLRIFTNISSLQDLQAFMMHGAQVLGTEWKDQIFDAAVGSVPRLPKEQPSPNQSSITPPRVFLTNPHRGAIGYHMRDWLQNVFSMNSDGKFRIVPVNNITHAEAVRWIPSILNCYLNDIHPIMPLVSKSHLINIYNRTEDPLTVPFLSAMGACSVILMWWDKDIFPNFPPDLGYARRLGTYYYEKARERIEDEFDTPSIYNVLTLLTLQAYCLIKLNFDKAKTYLSHARLLVEMMEPIAGTRSFPDTADMDPKVEKELFNRCNWVVTSMTMRVSFMHRFHNAAKSSYEHNFKDMLNRLPPPKALPFEDAACRLSIRAYQHLLGLMHLAYSGDNERVETIRRLLLEDFDGHQKVGMVPVDACLEVEGLLTNFYDNKLEDDLKWGRPFDPLTEIRLLELDPPPAVVFIMQQFYTTLLWLNIRFLPTDLTKLGPTTSTVFQFLNRAIQTCITTANNICVLASYTSKHTKSTVDFHALMLACEVHYSVAQLGDREPELAKQARRHLTIAVGMIRAWFAKIHGGSAGTYTSALWENGAFREWLHGAGIDLDAIDWNELLGLSKTDSRIVSGDSLIVQKAKRDDAIILDFVEEALVSALLKMGLKDT